ncbi:MAG: penicillin-binding protein 2 [Armatimonadetes bacterium]|nr:penicillin-binding protein 2 [Armatimonadota bacterium]MDW8122841.1 penicillin-binding protein 2 [Armatimonadota bacterium]
MSPCVRCASAMAFITVSTLMLAAFLFRIQVSQSGVYRKRAEKIWSRVVKIRGRRGDIVSRRGTLLATSVRSERLEVNLNALKDPTSLATQLSLLISDRQLAQDISSKLLQWAKKSREQRVQKARWILLSRRVSIRDARAISERIRQAQRSKDSDWTKVVLLPDQIRFYPLDRSAAPLLGFTDGDGVGQYGIERDWDGVLRGREVLVERQVDGLGRPLEGTDESPLEARPGHSLILTLDERIQAILDDVMNEAMKEERPRAAIAIVLDPRTGDILGLSSKPDFDPNDYSRFPYDRFVNRGLARAFEPGSSLKPLVAAVALEEGAFSLTERVRCEGTWKSGAMSIRCWVVQKRAAAHGFISVGDALRHSCNIAMAKIALKVPYEKLSEGLRRMGLGRRLSLRAGLEEPGWIDLPIQRQTASQRRHQQATIGFGQGLAVTPLQMVVAYSALAHYGIVMKPRLVMGIRNEETGQIQWLAPKKMGRAVSPLVAARITDYLVDAVKRGTGVRAQIEGVTVAGKTGTATKFYKGRFDPEKVIVSFCGYFPAESPKYVVGIFLDEPKRGQWGGEVAAPLFAKVGAQILRRVQPPRPPSLSPTLTALPSSSPFLPQPQWTQ